MVFDFETSQLILLIIFIKNCLVFQQGSKFSVVNLYQCSIFINMMTDCFFLQNLSMDWGSEDDYDGEEE